MRTLNIWKWLTMAVAIATSIPSMAQDRGTHGKADQHTVVNFADIVEAERRNPPVQRRIEFPEGEEPEFHFVPRVVRPDRPLPKLKSYPTQTPLTVSPSATTAFAGGTDNDTRIPPDTAGAVGPNHVVSTINTGVFIYNRSGVLQSSVSLDSFWTSLSPGSTFDPHAYYDPYGGRWIIVSVAGAQSASSSLLIAVSATTDPTGTWYMNKIDADSGDTLWADYPAVGFNKNWIVFSVNMFTNSSNSFSKASIFAFSKGNLYNNLTASYTRFDDSTVFTPLPATVYDNSLSTMYLVSNYNNNSSGFGYIRVSTITGSVGSETFTVGPGTCCGTIPGLVRTANTWGSGGLGEFAPQLGTTKKIDTGDNRFLSFVYRNGYLWASQTAFLPATSSTRTAAQWWQFSTSGTLNQFGRVDDSTGTIFYAYPSISVNANNDALLGYSVFSSAQYAAAGYSFRYGSDTLSTMQDTATLKAGEATYQKSTACWGSAINRWGDYSNTTVDPTNDVDLWTTQEYASSPNFTGSCSGDGRFGTYFGKIAPPEPSVSLSPTSIDFGNQTVSVASTAQTVTLTNTGHAALTISSVTASSNFSRTENCVSSSPIAAGGTCTVNVQLTPAAVGSVAGTLTFADNTSVTSHTVSLGGNGTINSVPVSLSAVDLNFGSVQYLNSSTPQTVTLTNNGSATLTITLSVVNPSLTNYTKTTTCGSTLAAGANCTVSITFKPAGTGTQKGVLTIADGTVTSPQTVALTGVGYNVTTGARARFSAVDLNFGSQTISTTSAAKTFTLTNDGDATLNVNSVTVSGSFAQTNNCGTSLTAGSTCTVNVTFTPTSTGTKTGAVAIGTNYTGQTGNPAQVRLFGTGTSGTSAGVGLSAVALNFGSQTANTTSASKSITVTNTGSATLTIVSVSASGNFAQTNNCSSVTVGNTCTINVTFTPTSTGSKMGSVAIQDNAAGSPQIVRLFGTGS